MTTTMIAVLALKSLWLTSIGGGAVFSLWVFLGLRAPEATLRRLAGLMSFVGLGLSLVLFVSAALSPEDLVHTELGTWFIHGGEQVHLELAIEAMEAIFLIVAHLILAAIIQYSGTYLHRDVGFQRFMLLLTYLQSGLVAVVSAGELASLIFSWEVVGLASFLLIGFFTTQARAGTQSVKAFVSYKVADFCLIMACILLHHVSGHTSLDGLDQLADVLINSDRGALLAALSLALIFGSLAKGGQFPFMTWMPRAMEGPTPSSAAFYGALSVHLAPLLLLKTHELWSATAEGRMVVGIIGLLTATLATLTGHTRSNVKAQLAYAVMTQVGLIYIEIALGYYRLAMAHLCCHALMRTVQYLRSASVLHDFEDNPTFLKELTAPPQLGWRRRIYIHAWNGFYLEAAINSWLLRPLLALSRRCHHGLNFTRRKSSPCP